MEEQKGIKLQRLQEPTGRSGPSQAVEEQRKKTSAPSIMAKERTGLEKKVAKDEKIERELVYYFRIHKHRAHHLPRARSKDAVEMARIAKAQELAKSGMTGVARAVADIIDDAKTREPDRERAHQREFDLKQQIAQLAKNAADYEFKLKEIQAKIAKQVGNFNIKVADYQTKMARRRHQEEMEAAIKANKLRTTGFSTFGDESAAYKNTAAQEGLSATNLLSFLYAGGAEKYGIGGGVTPEELTRILRDAIPNFDEIFSAGTLGFNDWLDKFAQEQGKAQGVAAFIRSRPKRPGHDLQAAPPPAPPRMEKLESDPRPRRNAQGCRQEAHRRRSSEQTMDMTAKAIAGLKLRPSATAASSPISTQSSSRQQVSLACLMGTQAACCWWPHGPDGLPEDLSTSTKPLRRPALTAAI